MAVILAQPQWVKLKKEVPGKSSMFYDLLTWKENTQSNDVY